MLKTCINEECKKLFNGFSEVHLCPNCQKKEKEYYMQIREFIKENPGSSPAKIHEETQIPIEIIMKLFEQGDFKEASKSSCPRCGSAMDDSRSKFCNGCAHQLTQQIGPITSKPAVPEVPLKSNTAPRTTSTRDSGKQYGLGGGR